MVELNIYTVTYIHNNKELKKDFIAVDPEIAVQNFARWFDGKYYGTAKLVELTLLAEAAVFYKTDKKKRK